jgi:ankyrin repeat protein
MTLRDAARFGNVVEVRRLLAMGVNLDQRDENGVTALLWAANR